MQEVSESWEYRAAAAVRILEKHKITSFAINSKRVSAVSTPDLSDLETLRRERETLIKNMKTVYKAGEEKLAELEREIERLKSS